jgi:hypothetical protein
MYLYICIPEDGKGVSVYKLEIIKQNGIKLLDMKESLSSEQWQQLLDDHEKSGIFGCIYMCMYIYMYVYMHICVYVYICIFVYFYIYICIYKYIYIHS